jgi:pectate lyase
MDWDVHLLENSTWPGIGTRDLIPIDHRQPILPFLNKGALRMKTHTAIPFLALALAGAPIAATPDFSMMGFATTDGGTTGGAGGVVVTPTTIADLHKYAEDKTTPYIIRITKEFNSGIPVNIDAAGNIAATGKATTYGDIIKVGSNKTLVGIGTSAFFNRVGIVLQCKSNVIIRNIRFTMKDVPIARTNENKVVGFVNGAATPLSDPDCIGMQADDTAVAAASRMTKHVWIDHCEFFNEDPAVMTDVDRYDGLTDGKNYSTDVTISWCYYHDHHKASLMGKGNSDDFDRHITYSHNYFKNIASRLPLIRFGKVHLLNNYMITSQDGANARINSDIYVEGNRFEDSKKPVFGKISEKGAATFVGNSWITCSVVPLVVLGQAAGAKEVSADEEVLAGTFKPSTFYSYTANSVADVAALVMANSGIGKISTSEYDQGTTGVASRDQATALATAWSENGRIAFRAPIGTPVRLADVLGASFYSGRATGEDQVLSLSLKAGVYLMRMGNATRTLLVR